MNRLKVFFTYLNFKLYSSSFSFFYKIGNEFLSDISGKMFESLYERTKGHFNNVLMLASTFMDPRYRSFKFIKDQSERDLAKFKAMNYIKSVCKDSSYAAPITPVQATPLSTPSVGNKRKNFALLCDDDEIEPVPERSNKEIIIAELQLYSTKLNKVQGIFYVFKF